MKKGFALIELIITIAVIGVLAAILVMVIPNAIEKANAKSALSDAKNTLTQCSAAANDSLPNCVIIVEKGGSYYVFSYTMEKGKLTECKRNPFKANSADELIGRMKTERTLYMSGSDTGFISAIDANIYDNVRVLYGCRLFDESSTKPIYMLLGDSLELPAVDGDNIVWVTENADIAAIASGKVTAKAIGETKIYAKQSEKIKAEFSVYVTEVVTVSSFAQIKEKIEENTPVSYLRVEVENGSLLEENLNGIFPITVPQGKFVSLDVTDSYIEYDCSLDNIPKDMFINDGGEFQIICTNKDNPTSINLKIDATEKIGSEGTGNYESCSLIKNTNKGLSLLENTDFIISCDNTDGEIDCDLYVLNNECGTMYSGSYTIFINCEKVHLSSKDCAAIYNGEGSILFIDHEGSRSGYLFDSELAEAGVPALVNRGYIPVMNNVSFSSDFALQNYGEIGSITNCSLNYNRGGFPMLSIESEGKVKSISDCEFLDKDSIEGHISINGNADYYESINMINIKSGGYIGSLSNVVSYCGNTVLFENKSDVRGCIESGRFYFEPKAEYIAKGKTVEYDESEKIYVVK